MAGMEALEVLADQVLAGSENVRTLQEPATALMMMESADPVSGGSFYVGEVLVTSCQVEIDGRLGCVIVVGDEPRRARAGAILDAMMQGPPKAFVSVIEQLAKEEEKIDTTQRIEWNLASRTRVKFETMEDRPYAHPR
jgi:alpha-D-ribose 1-methylphosphonate 5-triphosphate synthase subunit PhnG